MYNLYELLYDLFRDTLGIVEIFFFRVHFCLCVIPEIHCLVCEWILDLIGIVECSLEIYINRLVAIATHWGTFVVHVSIVEYQSPPLIHLNFFTRYFWILRNTYSIVTIYLMNVMKKEIFIECNIPTLFPTVPFK